VRLIFANLSVILTVGSTWAADGDAVKGKDLYSLRCAACHSVEYNGAGPAHAGVFGRKAGAVPNFSYSPALHSSSIVWSNETLSQWLADPEKLIPGQKMWLAVPGAGDRQDLIAYLKSLPKK
jgi:cytochrome c